MESMIEKKEEKNEDRGATMVEYALLAALIAVVCIVAITFLGQEASQAFSFIGSSVQTGNTPG